MQQVTTIGWTDTPPAPAAPHLTPRQVQIIDLLIAGNSVKQVACRLAVSPRTVKKHLLAARVSLGAHTRDEMIARAVSMQLVHLIEKE